MVQHTDVEAAFDTADSGAPKAPNAGLELEATDDYLKRAKADAHRSKAVAANRVAFALVLALALSLPFYVIAFALLPSEATATHLERIFVKWYDVVSPLVGAVVGALFGLTLSERAREPTV